jgi:DNA-binding transcriptional MerR regulator
MACESGNWPNAPGRRHGRCGTTSHGACCRHAARRTATAYDESDLRQIQQIRTLQDFGFDLEETRPFVDCLRAGHPAGDSCPASLAVYRRKLGELDALIGQLQSVRREVGAQLARAELEASADVPGGPEPRCELNWEDDE